MNLRSMTVAAAGLVLAASAAACSSALSDDDDVPVSYAPPAYYQTVNHVYLPEVNGEQ